MICRNNVKELHWGLIALNKCAFQAIIKVLNVFNTLWPKVSLKKHFVEILELSGQLKAVQYNLYPLSF